MNRWWWLSSLFVSMDAILAGEVLMEIKALQCSRLAMQNYVQIC